MPATPLLIKNTHLDGDPFFFEGGPLGVLLLHGLKATSAEVRPLAEFLFAKGFTVSGPLLPGHNTHPKDANRYTWKDWVTHTEVALAYLANRCEQVFIGGESTGALIALYLATYHPEISGVLTYAPATDLILKRWVRWLIPWLAWFIPYIEEGEVDGDDLPWRGYTAMPLKGLAQLLRLQQVTRPRLNLIRRPLLIIQGRQDARVPATVPQAIYDVIQSTLKEIHWMEHSSHCVLLDHEFDSVKEITLRFIEKASI